MAIQMYYDFRNVTLYRKKLSVQSLCQLSNKREFKLLTILSLEMESVHVKISFIALSRYRVSLFEVSSYQGKCSDNNHDAVRVFI